MKKYILLFAIAMILCFVACSDDDVNNIKLEKDHVEVLKGKFAYVYMLMGNGGYTTKFSVEDIVQVTIEHGTVKIKGLEYGSTELTIIDRFDRTTNLKIDVVKTLSDGGDGLEGGETIDDEDDGEE